MVAKVKESSMSGRTLAGVLWIVALFICQFFLSPLLAISRAQIFFICILLFVLPNFMGGSKLIVVSCLCGFLFDLSVNGPIGIMAVIGAVFAYCALRFEYIFLGASFKESLLLFAISTAIELACYFVISTLMMGTFALTTTLVLTYLPSLAMSIVFFIPIWFLLHRFAKPVGPQNPRAISTTYTFRENAQKLLK